MNIDRTTARQQSRPEPAGSIRRRFWAVAFSLLLLGSNGASVVQARPGHQPQVVQEGLAGPVIVLLNDDADSSRVIRESRVAQPQQVYSRAIRGFAADLSAAEVQRLARDPRVRAITPDLPVYAQAQTLPTGVDRIDADRNSIAKIDGNDTRVNAGIAILDSGIDPGHPDLNVAGGTVCTGSGSYADPAGHGTHVAGIAAAKDNGTGVVGVAPGARLYAVKILNSSLSGSMSNVICGLDWVIAHRGEVDIVNLSIAGTGSDQSCSASAYRQAFCNTVNAGVTVVAAAGNYGKDAATTAPATYSEVIAVSAFADYNGRPGGGASPNCSANYGDADDRFASYSNFGGDVDIVAPGTCIRSTVPGGGTGYKTGTSMASPHVAGAAALYIASNPGASPGSVRSYVLGQAQSQNGTYGISGDRDSLREPVLFVGNGYSPGPSATATPRPTAAVATATAVPSSGSRTLRGGGGATSTPRPGVTPQPTTSAPPTSPPTTGGRTIRGGGSAPTSTPNVGNPVPPGATNPTATPGGSRTIRGSVAGSSASGDGTGSIDDGNRTLRGASTVTSTSTMKPATATVTPTATPQAPTATAIPPTETPVPPTATEELLPTETPVPPTATEELLLTETPVPPMATEEIPPTQVPTPPPFAVAAVTDNTESGVARYATDQDMTTAWYADALPLETANANDATPGARASEAATNEVYLELDLGDVEAVGLSRWSFAELEYADQYEVQISSDGENWQPVALRDNAADYDWQELYIGADTRYVRFLFANPNGDPLLGALSEVELYAP